MMLHCWLSDYYVLKEHVTFIFKGQLPMDKLFWDHVPLQTKATLLENVGNNLCSSAVSHPRSLESLIMPL
jgi:hypothetical protein